MKNYSYALLKCCYKNRRCFFFLLIKRRSGQKKKKHNVALRYIKTVEEAQAAPPSPRSLGSKRYILEPKSPPSDAEMGKLPDERFKFK
jgi:hypothetical protein